MIVSNYWYLTRGLARVFLQVDIKACKFCLVICLMLKAYVLYFGYVRMICKLSKVFYFPPQSEVLYTYLTCEPSRRQEEEKFKFPYTGSHVCHNYRQIQCIV